MGQPGAELQAVMARVQALRQAGKPVDALKLLDQVLVAAPDFLPAWAIAGTVSAEQGLHDQAVTCFRRCAALKPGHGPTLYHLGRALAATGQAEEALAQHIAACDREPGNASFWQALSAAHLRLRDPSPALAAIDRALALAPDSPQAHRARGLALEKLDGRGEDAAEAFGKAAALKPGWTAPLENLAHLRRRQGDMAGVVAACDLWLAQSPQAVKAFTLKGLALRDMGREPEAAALFDFDRFVRVRDLDPPPGWPDLDSFAAAVADHAANHPTMAVPDRAHPAYHNDRVHFSGELLSGQDGPAAALGRQFDAAVRDYIETVIRAPANRQHPFAANFPERWRLNTWATLLKGQGNLDPHVHPNGYMSGVYYAELPETIDDAESQGGWLELGRPPDDLGFTAPPVTRRIQPRPGRLVLFPGYLFHATVPFQSDRRRVSIPFDLMPLP